MKPLLLLVLCLLPILASADRGATILDGAALLRDLQTTLRAESEPHPSEADQLVAAHTRGWISGLLQGVNLGTRQGAKFSFRVPPGIPVEQVMGEVVKFLSAHPERLPQAPSRLVDDALRAAYAKP
jgi:hypothetical protein